MCSDGQDFFPFLTGELGLVYFTASTATLCFMIVFKILS